MSQHPDDSDSDDPGPPFPTYHLSPLLIALPDLLPPPALRPTQVPRTISDETVQQVLADHFPSICQLRPLQVEAVKSALRGENILLSSATGSGKSVCFQLPAIVEHGESSKITVVITPTNALNDDQTRPLRGNERAHLLGVHSNSSSNKKNLAMECLTGERNSLEAKEVALIYMGPEMASVFFRLKTISGCY